MPEKKKYTGVLNKPMIGPPYALHVNGVTIPVGDANERQARERALYEHYGLEYLPIKNGHLLAMRMAENHIRGFHLAKKSGRPSIWQGDKGIEFFCRVELLMQQKKISILQALGQVAKEMGIKSSLKTLNSRYHGEWQTGFRPQCIKVILKGEAQQDGYSEIPIEAWEREIKHLQEEQKTDAKK